MKRKLSAAQWQVLVFCALMMTTTGASDALRGVFLPQFREHFKLGGGASSAIIMISYVGNLLFLFIGGYFADRVSRKKFIAAVSLMWMTALTAYVFTDSYALLLFFMIFSMGASTMLSTTVNLITPLVFASPAFFVNIFNFIQGIGISGAQNIGGRFASDFSSWHKANIILLSAAVVAFVLLMFIKIPNGEPTDADSRKKGSYADVVRNPACKCLILIFGFYFIAEHGLQNWLVTYGKEHLGLTVSTSAALLSVFFGGITLGRLLFAPLVQKFGVMKSMSFFVLVSTLLYCTGLLTGKTGIYLLCISGLAFSIIYPTLVLIVSKYYGSGMSGTATGFVTGIATFFDIAFNAFFGGLVERAGFGISIHVLTVSMLLFCIFFFLLKKRVPRDFT